MGRFLYRAGPYASDEDGVFAKNPEDTIFDAVEHVIGGNKQSRYLSASDSIMIVGEKYANGMPRNGKLISKTKNPIIIINADAIPNGFIEVYRKDKLSEGRLKRTGKEKTNLAIAFGRGIADREVLILKHIPNNAFEVIPPLLVDVLEYLENQEKKYQKIKNNSEKSKIDYEKSIQRSNKEIREKEVTIKNIENKKMAPDQKDKMIAVIENKIAKLENDIKDYNTKLDSIPSRIKESTEKLKTIKKSLKDIQELIIEGKGKELEEAIISGLELNELEKKFIELYYRGDKSIVGVGQIFEKCIEGKSEINGVDIAVAVRRRLIKKAIKSHTMQDEYGMDSISEDAFSYTVFPPGGFSTSSEIDKGRKKNFTGVGRFFLWYDNIFMKIKDGMRISLDYDIREQNNDTMDIVVDYMRYDKSNITGDLELSKNHSSSVSLNLKKLEQMIKKTKNKKSGKKVLKKAIKETEGNVKMSDIAEVGKKIEQTIETKEEGTPIIGEDL